MSGPFTACPNGRHDDGYPHDFDSFDPALGGPALMHCRRCGEVRALARPPMEAAMPSTALPSVVIGSTADTSWRPYRTTGDKP